MKRVDELVAKALAGTRLEKHEVDELLGYIARGEATLGPCVYELAQALRGERGKVKYD